MADWTGWPKRTTPYTVLHSVRVDRTTQRYIPVVYTEQLGLTEEKPVVVIRVYY